MIHYRFFTLTLTLSSKRKERHSPSPRPSPLKGEGDYGSGLQREREIKECGFHRGKEGDLYFNRLPYFSKMSSSWSLMQSLTLWAAGQRVM